MKAKSAIRYAQSLLELAIEQSKDEVVEKDAQLIKNIIEESRDFSAFLKNPIIKEDKKIEIMEAVFGKDVSKLTISFLKLIVKNKREKLLLDIAQSYIYLYKKHKNILVAELTSATKLDQSVKSTLLEKIKSIHSGTVELIEKVDPTVLGGFVLKMDDRQLDASVASKLRNLRKELVLN